MFIYVEIDGKVKGAWGFYPLNNTVDLNDPSQEHNRNNNTRSWGETRALHILLSMFRKVPAKLVNELLLEHSIAEQKILKELRIQEKTTR